MKKKITNIKHSLHYTMNNCIAQDQKSKWERKQKLSSDMNQ